MKIIEFALITLFFTASLAVLVHYLRRPFNRNSKMECDKCTGCSADMGCETCKLMQTSANTVQGLKK